MIFEVVPLTGLSAQLTSGIFFIFSLILSIVTAILFPKIFCSLWLKLKGKINHRYKDVYIEKTDVALTFKTFITRGFNIILLTLGLLALILPIAVDYTISLWLSPQNQAIFESLGIPAQYNNAIMVPFAHLILPIVIGILSIGWAIEDAGLMHYKFDARKGKELFEIEPIHIRLNSYIKGYAGISSLFFLIRAILAFSSVGRIMDMLALFSIIPMTFATSIPIYFIYAKVGGNHPNLRKNLHSIKELTENDILNESS